LIYFILLLVKSAQVYNLWVLVIVNLLVLSSLLRLLIVIYRLNFTLSLIGFCPF
jgi:hypothetical protein